MKIAVIMKDGFEEMEALGIIDMARRMELQCDIVSFNKDFVVGSHGVQIKSDIIFNKLDDSYDALVLPGGPGAIDLRDDEEVIKIVKKYNRNNKIIAAICAAPIVLEKAGIIENKVVTSYPTVANELLSSNYKFDTVQIDGNIITGNGPGATFAFAFAILEELGLNTEKLKEATQYKYLIENS